MPTTFERCYRTEGTRTGLYKEDASETFLQGDWVALDASGNVIALLALNAEHINSTTPKILGIVGRDGNNASAIATNQQCPVAILNDESTVELAIYSATPANAEQQDLIIGQTYALRNQGGVYVAMMDTTANGSLICVQKYEKDYAATDQYPRALFKIDPASLKFKS